MEAVQILVKHNADTEAQDNRKLTPLMVAFRKGHVKVQLYIYAATSMVKSKVVKFLVRHVSQFPNDQECLRYVATLTDQVESLTPLINSNLWYFRSWQINVDNVLIQYKRRRRSRNRKLIRPQPPF